MKIKFDSAYEFTQAGIEITSFVQQNMTCSPRAAGDFLRQGTPLALSVGWCLPVLWGRICDLRGCGVRATLSDTQGSVSILDELHCDRTRVEIEYLKHQTYSGARVGPPPSMGIYLVFEENATPTALVVRDPAFYATKTWWRHIPVALGPPTSVVEKEK